MSAFAEQNSLGFKCDGALSRGMVVKGGSDKSHVAKSTAATHKHIGLAMNDTSAAEESVDVALPGGGAAGLLGGTVAFGDLLTSDAAGKLVATTTADDKIVAQA